MALNGIDAQIFTQRAVDVAKDASNINKRNDLGQDYMALQRNAEDELQDSSVSKLERKDDPRIATEHEGSRQFYEDEQKKHKAKTGADDEETEEEPGIVSSTKIDIRI